MGSYPETRLDLIEYESGLKYDMPLAVDDMSLAFHLGIRNKTLWWLITANEKLYTTFKIPKRGKQRSWRDIQNPHKRLKAVQRLVLGKFLMKIPVGDHVGAYVPEKSCMETAKQHVGKNVIISIDIKDFFPSVKRSMIRHYLKSVGYNHYVSSMLSDLVTYQNFVPQGAPTSGFISNVVADYYFDQKILADLKEFDPQWTYTRYSDDIDVSHPETQKSYNITKVIEIVAKRVNEAGFRLNDKKTRVESYLRRQKVLGMVVNNKLNIVRAEYNRLRCVIHNCVMHGFHTQYKRGRFINPDQLITHTRGMINYIKQVDEEKGQHLEDQFDIALSLYAGEEDPGHDEPKI